MRCRTSRVAKRARDRNARESGALPSLQRLEITGLLREIVLFFRRFSCSPEVKTLRVNVWIGQRDQVGLRKVVKSLGNSSLAGIYSMCSNLRGEQSFPKASATDFTYAYAETKMIDLI